MGRYDVLTLELFMLILILVNALLVAVIAVKEGVIEREAADQLIKLGIILLPAAILFTVASMILAKFEPYINSLTKYESINPRWW